MEFEKDSYLNLNEIAIYLGDFSEASKIVRKPDTQKPERKISPKMFARSRSKFALSPLSSGYQDICRVAVHSRHRVGMQSCKKVIVLSFSDLSPSDRVGQ